MLERRKRTWEREMVALVEEKEELAAELKHLKKADSRWLITEGFGAFLTAVSQSEEFKSGLEQVYRAYRDAVRPEGWVYLLCLGLGQEGNSAL
ncbi:hypothetical protein HanPSC8_Chr16g0700361 [Helianthus annuus]|nr:hypothetical protein HanPSC8_Chr16g0700361 [Helianthus annuus]